MTRRLEAASIEQTAQVLQRRIEERFPGSGLSRVARDLVDLAARAQARSAEIVKPHLPLRVLTWSLAAILLAGIVAAMSQAGAAKAYETAADLLQGLDAAANLVLLFGAGIVSAVRYEEHLRRAKGLAAVHELKSIAHVVDMHQLTKHPEAAHERGPATASSPKRTLTPFELERYLDYCSELFSLIGKIAAVYGERAQDAVVLEAVDDVEDLTTGLARKVWQKISLLDRRRTPAD